MYHVCSFHKRLQTQLLPFRSRGYLRWNARRWWRRESVHTWGAARTEEEEEEKKKQKYTSLLCDGEGELKSWRKKQNKTNHQFHTEPTTVPNIRPISIQASLIPFGAFGALKGLIVPSSAPSLIAPPLQSSFGKYHGQPYFAPSDPVIRRADPAAGARQTARRSSSPLRLLWLSPDAWNPSEAHI